MLSKGFDARFGVFNMSLLALSPEPAQKTPHKMSHKFNTLLDSSSSEGREDFHYFSGKLKVENMIKYYSNIFIKSGVPVLKF